ncbi:hypothetical protein D3C84_734970 [compost metagenome]
MQGRADGRRLAHRAVTEILRADPDRREQQRNRRAGQQVLHRQLRRHTNTPVAQPGINGPAPLIEGDGLAGLITERRHRHRPQLLLGDGLLDARGMELGLEQFAQRRTVDQRHRQLVPQAQQAMNDETPGLGNNAPPVAAHDLMAAHRLPERRQPLDGGLEVHRPARQADRVDRPRRGADDHRERVVRTVRQQFGDGRQYAHLIRRPSPAAGKNQTCNRFSWGHRNAPCSRCC